MQSTMTSQLVIDALMMAIWRRGKPESLLHHSDQGSQYMSDQFQRLLTEQGIACSMSRAGEVWDNSAMESFFRALKMERVNRRGLYKTGQAAKADVFDCVECFTTEGRPCGITLSADTQRLDMSAPCNLNQCSMLKSASTRSGLAQVAVSLVINKYQTKHSP